MPRHISSTERALVNNHNRGVQNLDRALVVRVRHLLLLLLPLHIAVNLVNDSDRSFFKEWPWWLTVITAIFDALLNWLLAPLVLDFTSCIMLMYYSPHLTYWPFGRLPFSFSFARICSMCLEAYFLYDLAVVKCCKYLVVATYYTLSTGTFHYNYFALEAAYTSLRFYLSVTDFNKELQIFISLGELQWLNAILEVLGFVSLEDGPIGIVFELLKRLLSCARQRFEKSMNHLYKIRRRRASERLFLEACENGDKVAMRSLLTEHGDFLNVNLVRNKDGDTGLHLACRGGHATIAESLLDVKKKVVNVNIENSSGETPLMIAASVGHTIIMRRLLKAKGLKLKQEYGERSILKAVENEHYETAKQILVAIINKEGVTADGRLRNMLDYLDRCTDLSKKAEAAKSQVEKQRHTLSLDIYKKSIVDIIKPKEFSPVSQSSSNQKTVKEYIEDLREFLECSICFDQFEDLKIFACINDHWICMRCLPQNESCPFCRVDFDQHPPARRITSEKFLQILVNVKSDQ